MLLPPLHDPSGRRAVRFPDGELSYAELRARADAVAAALGAAPATPGRGLGAADAGDRCWCGRCAGRGARGAADQPEGRRGRVGAHRRRRPAGRAAPRRRRRDPLDLPRLDPLAPPAPAAATAPAAAEAPDAAAALVIYTSGTTGPPKGVVLSRGALAANLDALARAVGLDRRRRGRPGAAAVPCARPRPRRARAAAARRLGHHLGRFDAGRRSRAALAAGGTMLFAVPTMYHRLAAVAAERPRGRARRSAARACSSPAPRRWPPSCTTASRSSPARPSSSATG